MREYRPANIRLIIVAVADSISCSFHWRIYMKERKNWMMALDRSLHIRPGRQAGNGFVNQISTEGAARQRVSRLQRSSNPQNLSRPDGRAY
jgi:hypothetical protein